MIALFAVLAAARIGAWGHWGAFRDAAGCRAIAAPVASTGRARGAHLLVAMAPARGMWRQVHVRLSRPSTVPVLLSIDGRTIRLRTAGQDAHAASPAADAAIVGAMRRGTILRIDGHDTRTRPFRDMYRLEGAATAIDAATLACPGR